MVKPNYMCIGVQKAGTTSLINYMNQHPDVYMNDEILFFNRPSNYKFTKLDFQKYEKLFNTNKKMVGTKNPSDCFFRHSIDRIYDYDPNMKLILLLREPISRAYSEFNMYLQWGMANKNPNNILSVIMKDSNLPICEIKQENGYFIQRGYYDEQIEYILTKFPRQNLHIGIAEEIKQNKQEEYNKIFAFLGVNSIDIKQDMDTHIRTYSQKIPGDVEKELYKIYAPHNERLYKILGRTIQSWDEYYHQITKE